MCGLIGAAGKLDATTDKIVEQLLIVDSLRGTDSTGVATVSKATGYVRVAKQVGDPYNLFNDRRYDEAMRYQNKAIIGHNRWATVGGVDRKSAHPFEFDNIVGVHNGTLDNKYILDRAADFKVDSENLYWHIQEFGIDDAIGKVRGAWALVYWDKTEHTINFLRNKERPLHFVMDEKGEQLYWASERWMLQGVLTRNGVKQGEYIELETDMHCSIHIDEKGELAKPVIRQIKGAAPFVSTITPKVIGTDLTGRIEQKQPSTNDAKVATINSIDISYQSKKHVEFEVVCTSKDLNGQEYCVLFDAEYPSYFVRLYNHSCHAVQTLPEGTMIYADISGHYHNQKEGNFYKVSPWSAVVKATLVTGVQDMFEDYSYNSMEMFKDEQGNYMNGAAWRAEYSACSSCDDELIPEQANRFTLQGQVLCPNCVTEFKDLVAFK